MKERFAKLLLGEDMSGSGQGVSSALAISNAITNLCGTSLSLSLSLWIWFSVKVRLVSLFVAIPSFWSSARYDHWICNNFVATVFGQLWRLEPLSSEKKSLWRREMEWLLCVSDHIVELIPSWRTFADGRKLEVTVILTVDLIFREMPCQTVTSFQLFTHYTSPGSLILWNLVDPTKMATTP